MQVYGLLYVLYVLTYVAGHMVVKYRVIPL